MKNMKRFLTMCLALVMVLSCIPIVNAAMPSDAVINESAECSLTIYKYDWTNAHKDGVWNDDTFITTGMKESYVEDRLGGYIRKGETDHKIDYILGNGETSNSYAIKGVEYSIVNVAKPLRFSEYPIDDYSFENALVMQLYAFESTKTAELLAAIGLPDGQGRYEGADYMNYVYDDGEYWFYQSDVINRALATALSQNSTTVKNALEGYIASNLDTIWMDPTDADGYSSVEGLDVGLYLVVETAVPEMVTSTTNPFFVSLPMTTVSGKNYSDSHDGGHYWNYDVVVYPKNETGIPTLEKTVREAKEYTGKNDGTDSITDGFSHNATGSGGDVMEYQILSTLPTITSNATGLSMYTFYDNIGEGLSYNQDVKIEVFTDMNCTDKVASWTQEDGYFTVTYSEDMRYMSVEMTNLGLSEMNGTELIVPESDDGAEGQNGEDSTESSLYQGFSNHTVRVTYSATINPTDGFVFGTNGNCNEVALTWSRTSSGYYDALIDDCHVYSFCADITKVFSDVDSATAAQKGMFQNVAFSIYNETDDTWVLAELDEETGIYYVSGFGYTEAEMCALTPVSTEQGDGKIIIKGLEDDRYVITELSTANGYTLLKDSVTLEFITQDGWGEICDVYSKDVLGVLQNDPHYTTAKNTEGLELSNIPQKYLEHTYLYTLAFVDGNEVMMTADNGNENAEANLTVVNTRGFDLPKTGDVGTVWFTVIGVLVMAGAVAAIILVSKRKKESSAQ